MTLCLMTPWFLFHLLCFYTSQCCWGELSGVPYGRQVFKLLGGSHREASNTAAYESAEYFLSPTTSSCFPNSPPNLYPYSLGAEPHFPRYHTPLLGHQLASLMGKVHICLVFLLPAARCPVCRCSLCMRKERRGSSSTHGLPAPHLHITVHYTCQAIIRYHLFY